AILILSLLAACNINAPPQGGATPTIQPVDPTITPEITLTLPPSPTIAMPQVESATPTMTDAPATSTPTPTDTPGPFEHTIRAGDSLISIIQEYGYTDFNTAPGSIISEIVRI